MGYDKEASASEDEKDEAFDNFIRRFGTHYVQYGVFGAEYGADFYYTGYGTKPEMKMSLAEVKNYHLETAFEHHRFKKFKEAGSGRSFLRYPGGQPEFGPDKRLV